MNPFDVGYYSEHDLLGANFKRIGSNIKIARNCVISDPYYISIGDNVRIDSFCIMTASAGAEIAIGLHVHIAAYCLLSGGGGIELGDYSGISHHCCLLSQSDDFSGSHLTGPTVPAELRRVTKSRITLSEHVVLGAHCTVLPGSRVEEGSVVGANSLVRGTLGPWSIFAGAPATRRKARNKHLLEMVRRPPANDTE